MTYLTRTHNLLSQFSIFHRVILYEAMRSDFLEVDIRGGIRLHYITLHDITSHYITLHHITSHYIHITWHYICRGFTFHNMYMTLIWCITSHYITVDISITSQAHHITRREHRLTHVWISLHHITSYYITITSFYITFYINIFSHYIT